MPLDTVDVEHSIPELFDRQVRLHASRPAVVSVRGQVTYEELDRRSNAIAAAILAMGHRRGATLGILIEQGIEQIAAILGVLKCAGIYVPLDPQFKRDRLRKIISDAQPAGILTDAVNKSLGDHLLKGGFVFDVEEDVSPIHEPLSIGQASPDDHAYIYYTSGSTGAPKGVVDNHRNVIHNIARYTVSLDIGYSDRLTLLQSCGFSGAVSNIFAALLNGATLLPFDVRGGGVVSLTNWLLEQKPTIYHSVPWLFRQVAAQGHAFPSLRVIRLEGDRARPIDIEIFNRYFHAGCTLVNGLGATETGIAAQYFIPHGVTLDGDIVPVGRATPGVRIDVVDFEGQPAQPGALGEIILSSRYLACGYWQRPDLTAAAFSDSCDGTRSYRTRDLGRWTAEGLLQVHGRLDGLAKVRGEWVDPSVLESLLAKCPGVREAIVEVRSDAEGNAQSIAWIIPDSTSDVSRDRLRAALIDHGIIPQLLPAKFIILERWPLDANGKVDRRALPTVMDSSTSSFAPRTRTEQLVADVFRRHLGVPHVAASDDFFELGGDSLKAIEVCLELERLTGSELALGAFQHSARVAALAAMLDQSVETDCIVRLQTLGARPALFCVHAHMGHVFNLRELALQFAPERQFYGIQAIGLDGSAPPQTDLGAMADTYVASVLEHQPDGPYLLSGYCFGSWVALEMARRLRARGKRIAALMLIDPGLPPGTKPEAARGQWKRNARRLAAARRADGAHELLVATRGRMNRMGSRSRARLLRIVARWLGERSVLRKRALRKPADGITVMTLDYRPAPYDGSAVVLMPADKNLQPADRRAWQTVVRGGVQFVRLAGPTRDLLRHPYVRDVAMCLLARLSAD